MIDKSTQIDGVRMMLFAPLKVRRTVASCRILSTWSWQVREASACEIATDFSPRIRHQSGASCEQFYALQYSQKYRAVRSLSNAIDVSDGERHEKSRGLVVCVHGFLGHRVQFLPMASVLVRRRYSVLNYGYASRKHNLQDHAALLLDTIRHRVKNERPPAVHFVCHSFGGVVLRAAMKKEKLGSGTSKTVLVGPPARGCGFARQFVSVEFAHEGIRPLIRSTAEFVLGAASGRQFLRMTPEWFLAQGDSELPGQVLVIAGNIDRRINPLIPEDNDGVIAVSETVLPFKHYRLEERLTHNMLLYSPRVIGSAVDFLDGKSVGVMWDGVA